MELVQLRHFVTITQTLSFTRAAELAHISQPALSYQMRRLEEELGVKLFSRHGRTISLTAEGEIFLPMAQSILWRANDAVRMVRDHSGVETGDVTMGVVPSVANYLVPDILASFHQVFPRVRVNLLENADLTLQQLVAAGTADFAVIGDTGSPMAVDTISLGSENFFVVTSPSHPLAGELTIELGQLRNDDFALPAPFYRFREQVVEACRREGFEPHVSYHIGSLGTLKGLVRAGLAVSVLPSIALIGMARNGMAVLRVKGKLTRELFLVRSTDREISQAAQVLMTHVRSAVTNLMTIPARSKEASEPRR
jgi:LysR family transcriptional activator of glutamate synthase operon